MSEPIIAKELLDILVCPACHSELQVVEYEPGKFGLNCVVCSGTFPIRDGIPVMLLDEMIRPS
jgi:uncharacterized protein